MKKAIVILVTLFALYAPQVYACSPQTTVETVDYVYYDEQAQAYFINTVPDGSGSFWVVDLFRVDKADSGLLDTLNERLQGSQIQIEYNVISEVNDDIEIISSKIIN